MTSENQALLDSIRLIVFDAVAEAIVPVNKRLDILTERVDTLTERVDTLTERVDTLTERVDTLTERVDALTERVDALTERVDALTERVDAIETEQRDQRFLLQSLDARFTSFDLRVSMLEGNFKRIETLVDTIETRTSQLYSDQLTLTTNVERGFRQIRNDINDTLRELDGHSKHQRSQARKIADLEERVNSLQMRLAQLEKAQGAS
jgi:chromosome segregation ATPase